VWIQTSIAPLNRRQEPNWKPRDKKISLRGEKYTTASPGPQFDYVGKVKVLNTSAEERRFTRNYSVSVCQ